MKSGLGQIPLPPCGLNSSKCLFVFTHAPSERSVGLQMDFFFFSFSFSSSTPPTFCSYPAEKSSSSVPTRPKKAQVLFLPGRKKLKFCSYPAEKSSSFVPTWPRKAQVFVSWGGAWVFGYVCHLVYFPY